MPPREVPAVEMDRADLLEAQRDYFASLLRSVNTATFYSDGLDWVIQSALIAVYGIPKPKPRRRARRNERPAARTDETGRGTK